MKADAILETLIEAVSKRFAVGMRRATLLARRTEIVEFSPNRLLFLLRASPTTTVHGVKLSRTTNFSSSTSLIDGTDYFASLRDSTIRLLTAPEAYRSGPSGVSQHPAFAEVDYTGGWGADADAIVANYPEVASACAMEVVNQFKRGTSGTPGANSITMQSGQMAFTGAMKLLPESVDCITRNMRRVL